MGDPGLAIGECGSMSPRAKFRQVAESACSMEQIAQSAQEGAQLSLLKNCDSSLRSAACRIRRWAFFCLLTGRPRSHPRRREGWPGPACSELVDLSRSTELTLRRLACLWASLRRESRRLALPQGTGRPRRAIARATQGQRYPNAGRPSWFRPIDCVMICQ